MALIKCRECGKEFSDQANACPNCGCPVSTQTVENESNTVENDLDSRYRNTETKKNSGLSIAALVLSILGCTFIFGIILAIIDLIKRDSSKKHTLSKVSLFICALWILISFAFGTTDPEKPNANISVSSTAEESHSSETASAETAEESSEEQSNIFYPGETIKTDHLALTYISCGEYSDDNMFVEPGEGKKFLSFEFEFENISDSDVSVGSFDFNCYADGYEVSQAIITSDNALTSITSLSPGRKASGIVVFEVPTDSLEIEVEYETNFWTQDKIIFVYQ